MENFHYYQFLNVLKLNKNQIENELAQLNKERSEDDSFMFMPVPGANIFVTEIEQNVFIFCVGICGVPNCKGVQIVLDCSRRALLVGSSKVTRANEIVLFLKTRLLKRLKVLLPNTRPPRECFSEWIAQGAPSFPGANIEVLLDKQQANEQVKFTWRNEFTFFLTENFGVLEWTPLNNTRPLCNVAESYGTTYVPMLEDLREVLG